MSEHPYMAAIFRYWAIVVAAMLVGGLAAFGLSQIATPVYSASARLYFSINVGNTGNDLNQGSTYTQAQTLSFAQLAKSAVVLQPVIERLALDATPKELASAISVETPENTVILDIVASDVDPDRAAAIANEVARSLSSAVDKVAPKTLEGDTTVALNNITPATPSEFPTSPNTRNNIVAGLLLGLVLAVIAVVLKQFFDTRIRSGSTIESLGLAPYLGSIDHDDHSEEGGVLLRRDVAGPGAENYRRVRTNLAQATRGARKRAPTNLSIVVTSSSDAEGKSTVAINLALTLAEGGHRVALVDADLREPSVARYSGLRDETGLTDVLVGTSSLEEAIQHWGPGRVDVLTSGPSPVNPSELLTASAMEELHAELKREYDFVVFDTPDMLSAADAAILGRLADGVVIVAAQAQTGTPQLVVTLDSLEKAGAYVFGIVLNRAGAHPRARRASSTRAAVPTKR